MSLWAQFDAWATPLGDELLAWAAPEFTTSITMEWPLAKFSHALAIALTYLAFVLIMTPIMKATAPPKSSEESAPKAGTKESILYALSFGYNIVQVMLCSYMTIHALVLASRNNYSFWPCNAASPNAPPMGELLWMFYMSKVLDFMDTFFIIVKRSWKQLSFLHVYHHFTIFLFYWLNLRSNYDGDIYLTIVLNGFIHSIMYTYYFVSLHTKNIWWKSYLTGCQMVQFTIMMVQACMILFKGCGTMPPPRVVHMYFYYIGSLLFLFANFFIKSYLTGDKSKGKKGAKAN